MIPVKLNWLDRAIGSVAPRLAFKRGVARAALDETRGYDGAQLGRRTDGWKTTSSSADAIIGRSLTRLRARSRDLTRNNPHARKALSVWTNNIVSAGIVPRAKSGNPALDRLANEVFDEWSRNCDADGQLDFYGLQDLMVREMVEAGEVLVRRRLRRPEDGLRVPMQLQVLEADLLDETKVGTTTTGHSAIHGVEFDAIGKRWAYWLYPTHPGNNGLTANVNLMSAPVAASDVVHLYRKERAQARGVPWCSAVVQRFRDLDDYEDAEIVRKRTEACVVAIVLGAEAGDEAIAPYVKDGVQVKDASGNPIERFEPGLIAYAHGGKDIKFNTPGHAGGYPDYKKVGLHSIAAGYLVPYELLTGDLSEVNFSSARVGLVEFRRLVEAVQWLCIIPMALQPIWDWVCGAAFLAGELPIRRIPVEWDTPRFESVNPIDDANADLIQMRSGTLPLLEAIGRRTGRNPEEVLREHAATAALLDELGLVFDSDPRKVARAGTEQPSISKQAGEAAGGADRSAPSLRLLK